MERGQQLEPWWGQLSLGAAAVVLLVLLGRTFLANVDKRVTEDREHHRQEIERLTKTWEARLADQVSVRQSWEDAAKTSQKTVAEQSDQLDKLLPGMDTVVKTIEAIRQELTRR